MKETQKVKIHVTAELEFSNSIMRRSDQKSIANVSLLSNVVVCFSLGLPENGKYSRMQLSKNRWYEKCTSAGWFTKKVKVGVPTRACVTNLNEIPSAGLRRVIALRSISFSWRVDS